MASNITKIFTGNASPALAGAICEHLDLELGRVEVGTFADGETSVDIGENVRGMDVFVIQSTCAPANTNLMELLILLDALRRSSVRRVTAVIPYYGYARQDRKVKPRTPITAKLVADLISTAGAERVLCLDLHAGQIQGFFNIPVDNIYGMPVLLQQIRTLVPPSDEVVVVSPDAGGVERARAFAKRLDATIAIGDKRRERKDIAEVTRIVGDVDGKTAVIVDDIVSTGGSIVQTAEALREAGAKSVLAAITHPVLAGEAVKRIEESCIERFITTDTIPVKQAVRDSEKFVITTVAHLLGEAIRRIHNEESVSSLFV
ncbi:MAG: ribose-phosphate pyrophosphokinase [Deltaproteobacteria bacterium]|nr:ribose-phosphate pyrophosphokinase [Deltaproteobacteria bacterium]